MNPSNLFRVDRISSMSSCIALVLDFDRLLRFEFLEILILVLHGQYQNLILAISVCFFLGQCHSRHRCIWPVVFWFCHGVKSEIDHNILYVNTRAEDS